MRSGLLAASSVNDLKNAISMYKSPNCGSDIIKQRVQQLEVQLMVKRME